MRGLQKMDKRAVLIYDTTLRDGTQGEQVNFTAEEKLRVARRLDEFGIAYIEGGWPGSNPKDMRFFELARKVRFKNARLAAFGSTRRAHTPCAECPKCRPCSRRRRRWWPSSARAGTSTSVRF